MGRHLDKIWYQLPEDVRIKYNSMYAAWLPNFKELDEKIRAASAKDMEEYNEKCREEERRKKIDDAWKEKEALRKAWHDTHPPEPYISDTDPMKSSDTNWG